MPSICQRIWKTQQWPQDWKRSVFIPVPKKGNANERSSSVQFSRSVVSNSLRPHESKHTRPPCPSPTPEFTQTHAHECSNYHTITQISHASKLTLKILQPRLQQYMSWEIPDVQAGFRKGRGTRDQIANIHWIIEKARELKKKKVYFCFTDHIKTFDCVDHNKLWKTLKEIGLPDYLTCLWETCM